MTANSGASSSTCDGVRKCQAGWRGVGQHIVLERARKSSIDVHRAEEDVKRSKSLNQTSVATETPAHFKSERSNMGKLQTIQTNP